MLAHQRHAKIVDHIKQFGQISIDEMIEKYQISKMTAWRDLKCLEGQGKLKKVYGGAVRADQVLGDETNISERAISAEKHAIARYAAEKFVKSSQTIFIDSGTTTGEMIHHLHEHNLTIITNSLNTLSKGISYASRLSLIATGGVVREVSGSCVGPNAIASIQDFHADYAFLSGIGLSLTEGLMEPNPLEIEVKRAMVKKAAKVILLLESYKFGNSSAMSVVNYADIDEIVTDAHVDPDFVYEIQKMGVKVHLVHE
jgi:DeoR family glucitol operon repressor